MAMDERTIIIEDTLADASARKEWLQEEILALIDRFECERLQGLRCMAVRLVRGPQAQQEDLRLTAVEVEVRLL